MLWTPGNPPVPPPGERAGLAGALAKPLWERRRAPVQRLLAQEFDTRRAAGDTDGDDVISSMLRVEPAPPTDEAVDQLMSLVLAGHESNSAGQTWVLDRLSRMPELGERFASAPPADPGEDPVVRETLRLRPAVHSVMRRLTAPVEIGGQQLVPGMVTMVPIVLLHRDPEAFPDPDTFRPERFVDGPPAALYFPFGGGARRCLGEPLARAELGSVVPAVLRRLRLRPLWPAPERPVVRGTVLVPHRSELAVASPR
jgi:cytochrome P450